MSLTRSVSPPIFTHEPLPDALTHIRLIEVLQGKVGQHVVCTVSVWPLDTAPSYDAISYTWGDPALTVSITINGQTMVVRQNCEYVMQQWFTAKRSTSKYIWVDAVCIDQSNLKERGFQVTIMGKLYREAAQVLACVGPHSDDSEYLFYFCRRESFFMDQLHPKGDRIKESWDDVVWSTQWKQRIKDIFNENLTATHPVNALFIWPSTKARLRSACIAFLKRAYFSRVWM
jgi:hypothetical protein